MMPERTQRRGLLILDCVWFEDEEKWRYSVVDEAAMAGNSESASEMGEEPKPGPRDRQGNRSEGGVPPEGRREPLLHRLPHRAIRRRLAETPRPHRPRPPLSPPLSHSLPGVPPPSLGLPPLLPPHRHRTLPPLPGTLPPPNPPKRRRPNPLQAPHDVQLTRPPPPLPPRAQVGSRFTRHLPQNPSPPLPPPVPICQVPQRRRFNPAISLARGTRGFRAAEEQRGWDPLPRIQARTIGFGFSDAVSEGLRRAEESEDVDGGVSEASLRFSLHGFHED